MKDQKGWIAIAIGGTLAILVGIALAMGLGRGHKNDEKMNDQPTGLTFTVTDPTPTLDAKKPLRCYVDGAYVGDLILSACAEKNGIAAQKLDVGVDDSGNLTAAPTASLVPVPGAPSSAVAAGAATEPEPKPTAELVPATRAATGPSATCMRYSSNTWNKLSDGLTLGQCANLLFDTRCVNPGQASYGRWGNKTLRLVPKRVEQSDDNTNFRLLVEQGQGCSVPVIR
ncbi:MAG: hypothetical protein WBQ60_06290 [Asticcacaulis sp.]